MSLKEASAKINHSMFVRLAPKLPPDFIPGKTMGTSKRKGGEGDMATVKDSVR